MSSARVRSDAQTILRLGGPLIVNNLANAGTTFADTVMAGQLGARELAGLAVGVSWYNLCFFIGLGLLMALSPSVAHAYGARDDKSVVSYFKQSLWLVLVLSIALMWLLRQADWVLPMIGITPEIVPIAVGYDDAVSWGLPALFAFCAMRFTSEGLGVTRSIMQISLFTLVANVVGNWLLIYGKFGLPRLGTVGCAWATAIAMWMGLAVLAVYFHRHRAYREYRFLRDLEAPNWHLLQQIARIGLPISGSILAEGGLFVVAALMMGGMGSVKAAAHQVALNYASVMFMVPLAMNSATTIHVGHALGRGDRHAGRVAGFVGIYMCGAVMLVSAIFIALFNHQIAALYSNDSEVRMLAATLLLMAGVFQLSDGLQVGAQGALRGFKDTAIPMALTLIAYWGVGFPIAYVLGVVQGRGPVYVWLGLIVGLTVAAILLNIRYRRVSVR
jgi:multidrug resistance protein, MATE family